MLKKYVSICCLVDDKPSDFVLYTFKNKGAS